MSATHCSTSGVVAFAGLSLRDRKVYIGMTFQCKLRLGDAVADRSDELKVEPPVADRPPRSVGFLLSQLGFVASKGFHRHYDRWESTPGSSSASLRRASSGPSQQALASGSAYPRADGRLVDRSRRSNSSSVAPTRRTAASVRCTSRRRAKRCCVVRARWRSTMSCGSAQARGRRARSLIDLLQSYSGINSAAGVHPGLGKLPIGPPAERRQASSPACRTARRRSAWASRSSIWPRRGSE